MVYNGSMVIVYLDSQEAEWILCLPYAIQKQRQELLVV